MRRRQEICKLKPIGRPSKKPWHSQLAEHEQHDATITEPHNTKQSGKVAAVIVAFCCFPRTNPVLGILFFSDKRKMEVYAA